MTLANLAKTLGAAGVGGAVVGTPVSIIKDGEYEVTVGEYEKKIENRDEIIRDKNKLVFNKEEIIEELVEDREKAILSVEKQLNEKIVKLEEELKTWKDENTYIHAVNKTLVKTKDTINTLLQKYKKLKEEKKWTCAYLDESKYPEVDPKQTAFRCADAAANANSVLLQTMEKDTKKMEELNSALTQTLTKIAKCSDHECVKKEVQVHNINTSTVLTLYLENGQQVKLMAK